jgi:hypothetical protein
MRFEKFSFGSIRIDGVTHEHDVVIDRGTVRKRKKKASKRFRDAFGHTPLSVEEKIPWKCRRLVIGTGTGALPVMKEVKREAARRKIKLLVLPTAQAIKTLKENPNETIRPPTPKINPFTFRTARSNARMRREPAATQIAAVSSQHESHDRRRCV